MINLLPCLNRNGFRILPVEAGVLRADFNFKSLRGALPLTAIFRLTFFDLAIITIIRSSRSYIDEKVGVYIIMWVECRSVKARITKKRILA